MSPSNFGERYFSIRDQLASLMSGVASLANDAGLDAEDILPMDDLRGGLARPFEFGFFGEVNSGKSTLVNGLFGVALCRTNAVPETSDVKRYIHGPKAVDTKLGPGMVGCRRPLDLLHDFHVIDTPGLNAADENHINLMLETLPRADMIFCVLPVENPWGAAAWDFLAKLEFGALDKVVLVIQKADLRNSLDLHVIRGHVRDLCVKRLGRGLPVFAVSGLDACSAKQVSPPDRNAWRASGMADLEEHVGKSVCQSPARWLMLSQWRDVTARALAAIEESMEQRANGLREHSRFLDEVEREIDVMCEQFVKRLPAHLAEVANVFEQEARGVTKTLSKRLGVARSMFRLFTRTKVGKAIAGLFAERLKAAVETVADADASEAIGFCQAHWRALGPRVEEALAIRLGGDDAMMEAMEGSRGIFVRRLGHAAEAGIAKLSVRRRLDEDLRMRNLSLTSFAIATLLLTTAGAICGGLGMAGLPWILCGLAAMFFFGGVIVATITRRSITRAHRQSLVDACGRFAATLSDDYEEALRILFRDYAQCLRAVREHLVRESLSIEPRQRRWQEMFLHLKAIEQEI